MKKIALLLTFISSLLFGSYTLGQTVPQIQQWLPSTGSFLVPRTHTKVGTSTTVYYGSGAQLTGITGGAGASTTINGAEGPFTFTTTTGIRISTSSQTVTFTNTAPNFNTTTSINGLTGAITGLNIYNTTTSINGLTGAITGLNIYNTTTTITGTTNQITASAPTGAVTLSLPQNIHTGALPNFAGLVLAGTTTITGAGGGTSTALMKITPSSTYGSVNLNNTDGALNITNTLNNGVGLQIYSDNGASGVSPLQLIYMDNTAFTQPILRLINDSTSAASTLLRLDSAYGPSIAFIETSQVAPAGKFQIIGRNDNLRIEGRNAADNSFDEIAFFNRPPAGGTFMLPGDTNIFSIPTGVAKFELQNTSTTMDYMHISSATTTNLGNILTVDGTGKVGVGTSTPISPLHVIGSSTIQASSTVAMKFYNPTSATTSVNISTAGTSTYMYLATSTAGIIQMQVDGTCLVYKFLGPISSSTIACPVIP